MAERGLGRRSALAALASGVALPVLAGCSDGGGKKHKDKSAESADSTGTTGGAGGTGSTGSTSAGGQAEAAPAGHGGLNVLMIIRHAEKPTGSGAPYGLTSDGTQDSHSLTIQGWTRAGALAALFDPRDAAGNPVALRAGLTRPGTVAASAPGTGGSNSKRPEETVTPTAAALGVTLSTQFSVGQEAELAGWLTGPTGPSGPTLVAWEHQHIPDIITHLGPVTPAPPKSWPGERFDIVYVFTRASGGGWTFTQVPQMLLVGDLPTPIS
ncbi:hypothetical protein KGQ20_11710 [Catenulispora sp. NF23]|uniref:hypothetical protein n=1 Tax=Catenulispora pinistramenti TaxID=2705254 RepID=UPI001BA84D45|nr:hypothetical protein [Catenulispora pinistramenti]MBS2533438.1 hypothetical protein [Catenulispora pinistramenti]